MKDTNYLSILHTFQEGKLHKMENKNFRNKERATELVNVCVNIIEYFSLKFKKNCIHVERKTI